jgi:hypothetical protein
VARLFCLPAAPPALPEQVVALSSERVLKARVLPALALPEQVVALSSELVLFRESAPISLGR